MYHVNHTGTWTLGVKIGLPFAILGLIGLVVGTVLCFRWYLRERNDEFYTSDRGFALGCTLVGIALQLVLIGSCLYAYFPYSAEYHQYRTVTGTVERISNRLIVNTDSDGNTSGGQKFVVIFKGSGGKQYGINDTRASLVRPGDKIAINCIRVFEYGSTDGYDCKWGGRR